MLRRTLLVDELEVGIQCHFVVIGEFAKSDVFACPVLLNRLKTGLGFSSGDTTSNFSYRHVVRRQQVLIASKRPAGDGDDKRQLILF